MFSPDHHLGSNQWIAGFEVDVNCSLGSGASELGALVSIDVDDASASLPLSG